MRDLNYLKRGVECIKIQESRLGPKDRCFIAKKTVIPAATPAATNRSQALSKLTPSLLILTFRFSFQIIPPSPE